MSTPRPDDAAPLNLHRERVLPEWLDYNEHMNVAYYVLAFDHATDAFANHIGIGWDHTKTTRGSIFIVEAHIAYLREVLKGDPLRFATHVLDFDEKRIHFAHEMYQDDAGYLSATNDLMMLHVDLDQRRAVPMPKTVLDSLFELRARHAALPRPKGLSRAMGLSHPKTSNKTSLSGVSG